MVHDIQSISRDIGLALPGSARVIGSHRERGIDDAVLIKLEMPTVDWRGLQTIEPLKSADFSAANRGYLPSDDGWWDPGKATDLRAAQIQMPDGRVLNIGADEGSKPGTAIVYVMNHGT